MNRRAVERARKALLSGLDCAQAPAVAEEGLPAAVFRGGSWSDGADAGVFTFNANNGPSLWANNISFRCGRHR